MEPLNRSNSKIKDGANVEKGILQQPCKRKLLFSRLFQLNFKFNRAYYQSSGIFIINY